VISHEITVPKGFIDERSGTVELAELRTDVNHKERMQTRRPPAARVQERMAPEVAIGDIGMERATQILEGGAVVPNVVVDLAYQQTPDRFEPLITRLSGDAKSGFAQAAGTL
jgi:hypothetical protein